MMSPALPALLASSQPIALFEDNLGTQGARLFFGLAQHLCALRPEDVADTLTDIETASQDGHWVVLAACYELGYALEPALLGQLPATARPLLEAWVWTDCARLDAAETAELLANALDTLPDASRAAGLSPLVPAWNAPTHAHAIEAVQSLIRDGDCYQVNLTFPMHATAYGDPLALYARLRAHQPVQYGAFVRHARGTLLSRSPELFVERRGDRLTTRPMKGTAPRGERERLAASEKDRAENLMIVDLLRNDLGRLAPAGGVKVTRLFEVEDYATVHQLTSTIEAGPVSVGLAGILGALFPCGSITGAPKIRAMQIIRKQEPRPRGLYCGALGWLAPGGDFTLSVPIRTLELTPDGAATLNVGSGIVADSVAADEYAECLAKARFASELAPPFKLIETMLYRPGQGLPLLERHLARLARSASTLGFVYDLTPIRECIVAEARRWTTPARLRLTLAPNGQADITSAPLAPLPELPSVTVSPQPLPDHDFLRHHKTTARAHYDAELAQATAQGHFDVLFFNPHGELCEGARSNVFVQIDGQRYTPPLESGALPGVMREEILAHGEAQVRVIERAELEQAEALYVSNALRGLIRVRLA